MAVDTINRFKIWDADVRTNPHPLYAQMRAEAPVYEAIGPVTGNRFWFLTRYDDCVAVLKDHEHFANNFRKHLTPEQIQTFAPQDEPANLLVHLLNVDPPDHTRLRTLVHKAFTPRMVDRLQTLIEQTADHLLDAILTSGTNPFDLVDQFAFPLPITVIAALLGVPPEERDQFRDWSHKLLFVFDESRNIAAMEMIGYINAIIEERRTAPQDDLISALAAAEDAGDKLDHQELVSMIVLLLIAGHETTVNLLGTGTLNLLRNPDQLQKLRDNPTLVKSAVEEMLRCDGAAESTFNRYTTSEVEIRGIRIGRGEIVMPLLLAANRDPEVFEKPDQFDITRDPNRHIAFGAGIHYCVGAPLARMETAVAINAMLRKIPHLALATAEHELAWKNQGMGFRGLHHLLLRS